MAISDLGNKLGKRRAFLMQALICAIIWYKEVIQRYVQISNMLLLLGVLLTAVVFLDNFSSAGNHGLKKLPKACYLIFFYMAITYVIGFVSSPDIRAHMTNGLTVCEFALVFVYLCYYGKTRGNINFIIWNYVIMYTFMCAVFIISPTVYYEGVHTRYSFSANMNPNAFAMALATGMWAILYMVSQKKIKIYLGLPICGLMLYACFMTASKKGFIGMLICLASWLLFVYLPMSPKKSTITHIGRLVVIILVIVLMYRILMPFFEESALFARFQNIKDDDSTTERMDMYVNGLKYLKASPIIGHGFWGFQHFYQKYSHSTWVEVLVSSGIPIAIIYFASYFNITNNLIKLKNKAKKLEGNVLQNARIRQLIILFIMLLFYTICIIHVYNLNSMIAFAMLISAYTIENDICAKENELQTKAVKAEE